MIGLRLSFSSGLEYNKTQKIESRQMSPNRLIVLPQRQMIFDEIPFRLELDLSPQQEWWCRDGSYYHGGVAYRCYLPQYRFGYQRKGVTWSPLSDVVVERESSALVRRGRVSAVQFTSGYSTYAIRVNDIDARIMKMIFLWERDFNYRPRCFYQLGAFLEWLEQRVDAGERLSHKKPFFFEEWREYGPHNEEFQRERERRESLLKAGETGMLVKPVQIRRALNTSIV